MDVTVAYWRDDDVVEISGEWAEMPTTGVLWVDLGNHRMQGMDNYWVHEGYYGAFIDPENRDIYEGKMESRWKIDPFEKASRVLPPADAHVIQGVLIPDEDARRLGLI